MQKNEKQLQLRLYIVWKCTNKTQIQNYFFVFSKNVKIRAVFSVSILYIFNMFWIFCALGGSGQKMQKCSETMHPWFCIKKCKKCKSGFTFFNMFKNIWFVFFVFIRNLFYIYFTISTFWKNDLAILNCCFLCFDIFCIVNSPMDW